MAAHEKPQYVIYWTCPVDGWSIALPGGAIFEQWPVLDLLGVDLAEIAEVLFRFGVASSALEQFEATVEQHEAEAHGLAVVG